MFSQFNSVTQSCTTLCDLMDFGMPGLLPVHQQLPELAQTHVHWVSDSIQPSHPLSFPFLLPSIFSSIRVFSNESVFRIRCPSIGASASASVLPMNIQGWFLSGLTSLSSLQSKGFSRVFFSSTTFQKHQFFSTQPSLWSNFHICTWLLEKPQFWLYRTLLVKVVSAF